MGNVHDFSEFFFVLRAPWIKPRRMHPTFMRGNLIVSKLEVQVARDPELNLSNHIMDSIRILMSKEKKDHAQSSL